MKNNNYWMTCSFGLMSIISILAGFTTKLEFVRFTPHLSVKVFLLLSLSTLVIQLPSIFKNALEGLKKND